MCMCMGGEGRGWGVECMYYIYHRPLFIIIFISCLRMNFGGGVYFWDAE